MGPAPFVRPQLPQTFSHAFDGSANCLLEVPRFRRALERQSEPLSLRAPVVKRRVGTRVLKVLVQRAAEHHLHIDVLGINQKRREPAETTAAVEVGGPVSRYRNKRRKWQNNNSIS